METEKQAYEGLKPHQYEDIFFEEDVPLDDVRDDIKRTWVYYGGAIILLFILLGSFIKIPRQLELGFVIEDKFNSEQIITIDENIIIDSLFVEVGDSVEYGTPIAIISGLRLNQLLADYKALMVNLDMRGSQDSLVLLARKEQRYRVNKELDNKVSALNFNIEQLETTKVHKINELENNFKLLSTDYERNKVLYEKGVISLFDFEKSERDYNTGLNQYLTNKSEYEKEIANLAFARTNLNEQKKRSTSLTSELELTFANQSQSLKNQANYLLDLIKKHYGAFDILGNSIVLKAEKKGVISYKGPTGKTTPRNSPLLKIYSGPRYYKAVASIPASLIGRVRDSVEVKLKLTPYPHYDWGFLTGEVRNLSLTPNPDGELPFEVEIEDYGKLHSYVQKGMTGKLSMILEERSFLSYLFSKIKKEYFEASN
ncbi:MAG: HlyD family efflux transporter periplasmic adaptor subunit [Bacteroidota bacterium]